MDGKFGASTFFWGFFRREDQGERTRSMIRETGKLKRSGLVKGPFGGEAKAGDEIKKPDTGTSGNEDRDASQEGYMGFEVQRVDGSALAFPSS